MGLIRQHVLLPNQMLHQMEEHGDPREVMIEAIKKHLDNFD